MVLQDEPGSGNGRCEGWKGDVRCYSTSQACSNMAFPACSAALPSLHACAGKQYSHRLKPYCFAQTQPHACAAKHVFASLQQKMVIKVNPA